MMPKAVKVRDTIGAVFDIGLGLLFAAIILGKVALPTFYAVSTSGFDSYTVLVWGIIPLAGTAGVLLVCYNRAKYAYALGGQGGFGM